MVEYSDAVHGAREKKGGSWGWLNKMQGLVVGCLPEVRPQVQRTSQQLGGSTIKPARCASNVVPAQHSERAHCTRVQVKLLKEFEDSTENPSRSQEIKDIS